MRYLNIAILLGVVAVITAEIYWMDFQFTRQRVLDTDPKILARLGRHLIVGYQDRTELERLLALDAVGGFYVTSRNIEGLSGDAVKSLLAELKSKSGSVLAVMADQEGGKVARLSPPLEQLPTLATLLEQTAQSDWETAVRNYARIQSQGMSRMGFNINLAPVVDVNHRLVNAEDKHTRIYQRAISTSPEIISQVAGWYCDELARNGVLCTLKHFPGLGRVATDTHLSEAALDASIEDMERSDWKPFRHLMQQGMPVMLSHVRVNSIDATQPASTSIKVVHDLLRQAWQFEGILMTDDFSMSAISDSDEGAGGAAVKSLNAGVDFILVSYRPELYYEVMDALIKADREGRLNGAQIEKSKARIARALNVNLSQMGDHPASTE